LSVVFAVHSKQIGPPAHRRDRRGGVPVEVIPLIQPKALAESAIDLAEAGGGMS